MRRIITIFLFLVPIHLIAQNFQKESDLKFIYALTNEQAKAIVQADFKYEELGEFFQNADFFDTLQPIDTLQKGELLPDYPKGHYVMAKTIRDKMEFSLISFYEIGLVPIPNKRKMRFYLVDSLGNLIKSDKVKLNGRTINYNKQKQYYECRKFHNERLLIIEKDNEIVFYEIEGEAWFDSFIDNIVETFEKWTWSYDDFKTNLSGTLKPKKKPKTYGYITTNKPKYLPNDTLKIKAYLTNKKGKPLDVPLKMKMGTYQNPIFETTIYPTTKGSYIFEMPLADSLTLDKRYYVHFYKNARPDPSVDESLIGTYFDYEDYQLEEAIYKVRLGKTEFQRTEPVVFYLSGKDINGQNIFDAQTEVIVKPKKVKAFYAKQVIVPDTIFYYQNDLIYNTETDEMRFVIPKEQLPLANIEYEIIANFTNANGEYQTKTIDFEVFSDSVVLDARLKSHSLMIDYWVNGQSIERQGKLEFNLSETDFYIEKEIKLPYRQIINPIFERIIIEVDGKKKELDFENDYYTNSKSNIRLQEPRFFFYSTEDSIFVFGRNHNNLEVNYSIYRSNIKVGEGISRDRSIIWKDKIRKNAPYYVDYEFVVNGRGKYERRNFEIQKNRLDIEIEQPKTINPGETVDVAISVKNQQQKPVKNVNLVAGAVNKQFGESYNRRYLVPIEGRQGKRKNSADYYYYNEINSYDYYAYDIVSWKDTINTQNRTDYQLDSSLFYQLLFADNGYFETKIPTPNSLYHAQFAPFIIKNNQFQAVYLIYANRELLYYHDTKSPYSCKAYHGYNNIVIRGYDFELHIDSVYLEFGQKVVFSVDLDNLPKNAKLYSMPNQWTNSEKAILEKMIFTFRQERYGEEPKYVWQDDIVYYSDSEDKIVNLGPFNPNRDLHFIHKQQFKTRFLYEPKFEYEIEENRERLYEKLKFPTDKPAFLEKIYPILRLTDTLSFDKNIIVHTRNKSISQREKQMNAITTNRRFRPNFGKVNFQIQDSLTNAIDSTIHAFIFHDNDKFRHFMYKGDARTFGNLPKGNYTLYGYTIWGNYFEKNVEIKKDSLTYKYLENLDFQSDSGLVFMKYLLNIVDVKTSSANFGNVQVTYKKSEGNQAIRGQITDFETNQPLTFANINLIQKGITVQRTQTDSLGRYYFNNLEAGKYDIKADFIDFQTQTCQDVIVFEGKLLTLNIALSKGNYLDEIFVTYQVPLIEQDHTTMGRIRVSSVEARYDSMYGTVSNDDDEITIRGSRSNGSDYYIDGIRVPGALIPQSMIETVGLTGLETDELSGVRSNFKDYAFWQPNLITDENGEAKFRVTYPDNITSFQTFVMGMNDKKQFGIATKTVKSQKNTLAQLAVPRFLIEGDKTNIIGKALNYTNDSLRIKSSFLSENNILESNEFWLNNAKIETAEVVANTGKDTLLLAYKIENNDYFDGEKRPIPIYKKGVKETVGTFHILENETTLSLNFDREKGNVKLYAQTDILEVLLEDIQYLIDYPYGCNEQTASRLLALLMDKQIKTALGQTLPKDEAIMKMVKRLEKSQNDDGSWGWWTGNATNYWMTNYVLKALHAADTSGYKTPSYETGLRFVTNTLNEIPPYELLNSIELLSDVGQNMNYKPYLEKVDTNIRYNDYYNQLRMTKIKQQQGLDYDLLVLDSLEKQTLFGNIFYDIDRSRERYYYWYWYSNHYNLTQMAYQILKNENAKQNGEFDYKLAAMRGYFLEKRTRRGWRNTFTTAQILATILPDMTSVSNRVKPQLVIKGASTQTVTEFPFETTFYSNRPIEIQKTGTSTVYLTGYQEFWNEKPTPKSDIFELKSKLVQNGKTVKKLEAKTPAKMVVTLEVKKEAEYVMVEVPIPAGCSYGDKNRGYGYWYGREVHREYFREKTCVFYKNLPVGTYTIEINLEPRFTGEYTVNPAKAEQMYFPVFYGRNAIKEVEIE